MVDCNYILYPWVVSIQLEIVLHFQQLGLNLFSFLMLTIESWWINFVEFTLQDVYLRASSLSPSRIHTWATPWPWNCRISSGGFPWRIMVSNHDFWLPIIPMITPYTMGFICAYLSRTIFLLGAKVFFILHVQHNNNLKYLFIILHIHFIIIHIYIYALLYAGFSWLQDPSRLFFH